MRFNNAQFLLCLGVGGLLLSGQGGLRLWGEETAGARALPGLVTTPPWSELRIVTTPDLQQSDTRLGLGLEPGPGHDRVSEVSCGPVAASNGLAFLAAHGFPALLTHSATWFDPQVALVQRLETARYLAITAAGATTTDMLRGLSSYVADCGYHCRRLEYQGNHTPIGSWHRYKTGDFPARASLRKALEKPGSLVLLDIGWYRREPEDATALRRTGGHWVLAVGMGVDAAAQEVVFIRNPESLRLPGHALERGISFRPIDARWLVTAPRRWTKAAGYEEVEGAALPHRLSHRAVLEGLVMLEIGA